VCDGHCRSRDDPAEARHALAVEFRDAVKRAEAEAKLAALERIQLAGRGGTWQADAWYLERKCPREFGRRLHEISGRTGGPVEVAGARERVAELLARVSGGAAAASNGNGNGADSAG
jgi:hypothetical protein